MGTLRGIYLYDFLEIYVQGGLVVLWILCISFNAIKSFLRHARGVNKVSKVENFCFAGHCSAPCAIYGLKVGMGTLMADVVEHNMYEVTSLYI